MHVSPFLMSIFVVCLPLGTFLCVYVKAQVCVCVSASACMRLRACVCVLLLIGSLPHHWLLKTAATPAHYSALLTAYTLPHPPPLRPSSNTR